MQHRATEMRSGAYMVATLVSGAAELHFGGAASPSLLEALNSAWRALGTVGILTAEEVEAVNIPGESLS